MVSAAELTVEKMQGKLMKRAEAVCERLDAYYLCCKRDFPNDKAKLSEIKKMVEGRKVLVLEEAEETAGKMSEALDIAAGDSSTSETETESTEEGPPNIPSEDDSVTFTDSESESVSGAVDSDAPTSDEELEEGDDDSEDDLPADELADSVSE